MEENYRRIDFEFDETNLTIEKQEGGTVIEITHPRAGTPCCCQSESRWLFLWSCWIWWLSKSLAASAPCSDRSLSRWNWERRHHQGLQKQEIHMVRLLWTHSVAVVFLPLSLVQEWCWIMGQVYICISFSCYICSSYRMFLFKEQTCGTSATTPLVLPFIFGLGVPGRGLVVFSVNLEPTKET